MAVLSLMPRERGAWRVQSHHREGVFEAQGEIEILLDGSLLLLFSVTRSGEGGWRSGTFHTVGKGRERGGDAEPCLEEQEEGLSATAQTATSGPGLQERVDTYIPFDRTWHPVRVPRPIPPTSQVQDMAESDSIGSPFGANVCTTSGSRLLLQGERNNCQCHIYRAKNNTLQIGKIAPEFYPSNLVLPIHLFGSVTWYRDGPEAEIDGSLG